MNIVFVCTGNTCRSPMAEAIFREKTQEFSGYCTVISCGLAASVGSPPSDNAVKVMSEIGIDISAHRSNPMSMYIIDRADYIICLSESHLNALKPYAEGKLILLGGGISDPFAGSEDTYRKCRDEISDGIDKLLASDIFFKAGTVDEADADEIAKMEKSIFSDPWSRDSVIAQIKKDYN
ncbi:MAG: low molecular weight protein arginine phosphatase, partial [Clostridiales bacterium]|nr:low molecular weight protein arginine phosphatase [Clostridiales bacterium]